jgi:hypothetical protein
MRMAIVVYGLLYVVVEVVGHQLEQVSWPALTPLDVASAITDAVLTVVVLVAVLVAVDVLGHRWRRRRLLQRQEEARVALAEWTDPGVLDVRSWRAEPEAPRLALTAGPARSRGEETYVSHARARSTGPAGSGRDHLL